MERDGGDGKWGKINQGETVAEVMSRRTCANRSGSLAGWLAEAESNRGRTTAPYLNPFLLYFFICLALFFILFPVPTANLVIFFSSLLSRHSPPSNSCTHLKPS